MSRKKKGSGEYRIRTGDLLHPERFREALRPIQLIPHFADGKGINPDEIKKKEKI